MDPKVRNYMAVDKIKYAINNLEKNQKNIVYAESLILSDIFKKELQDLLFLLEIKHE